MEKTDLDGRERLASITPKGEAAREKIYGAAISLITEFGFELLTVPALCKEAGISVGAFYHHFSSKNDILLRYVRDESSMIYEHFRAMDSLPRLEALMRSLAMFFRMFSRKGRGFVSAFLSLSIANPSSYYDMREFSLVSILEESLRAAIECGEIGSTLPLETLLSVARGILWDIIINWSLGIELENPEDVCLRRLGLLWHLARIPVSLDIQAPDSI